MNEKNKALWIAVSLFAIGAVAWTTGSVFSPSPQTPQSSVDDAFDEISPIKRKIDRIISLNSREQQAKSDQLYRLVSSGLVEDESLQFSNSKTVSILARWIEVNEAYRESRDSAGDINTRSTDLSHEFVGFIEGRLGCQVPRFWMNGFKNSQLLLDLRMASFEVMNEQNEGYWQQGEFFASRGFTVSQESEDVVISRDGREFRLSDELLDGRKRLNVCIVGDSLLVLAVSRAHFLPLVCFDLNSCDLLWSSEVFAGHDGLMVIGAEAANSGQLIEYAADDEKVILFGMSTERAYCQDFELRTGESSFFFSTSIGCNLL